MFYKNFLRMICLKFWHVTSDHFDLEKLGFTLQHTIYLHHLSWQQNMQQPIWKMYLTAASKFRNFASTTVQVTRFDDPLWPFKLNCSVMCLHILMFSTIFVNACQYLKFVRAKQKLSYSYFSWTQTIFAVKSIRLLYH